MFKEKTLLVVGAGASSELGMPIGSELSDTIHQKSAFKFQMSHLVHGDEFIYHHIKRKYSDIKDSNLRLEALAEIYRGIFLANSIDNFIEMRNDNLLIAEVGKLLIATSIAQAEGKSSLFVNTNKEHRLNLRAEGVQGTWLEYFSRILFEKTRRNNIEQIARNVSIICFNYDRCIEYYLTEAIFQTYEIPYNDAHKIVSEMEIVHPYGSLGSLPHTQSMEDDNVKFGYDIERGLDPWPVSTRIKTFTEQLEDHKIVRKIRSMVANARQIMFLGFAFHPQNMKLLKCSTPTDSKKIYATGIGISPEENTEVVKRILSLFADERSVTIGGWERFVHLEHKSECNNLFKMHGRNVSGA